MEPICARCGGDLGPVDRAHDVSVCAGCEDPVYSAPTAETAATIRYVHRDLLSLTSDFEEGSYDLGSVSQGTIALAVALEGVMGQLGIPPLPPEDEEDRGDCACGALLDGAGLCPSCDVAEGEDA
jgi:hypothetical protein